MQVIIEKEVIELEKVICNPIVEQQNEGNPEVLRIEFESEFTRIDFIYFPSPKYVSDWWINIASSTYIRPIGSVQKLPLISARNIPLAPRKRYLQHKNDVAFFSLFFPALPEGTREIDIIESESPKDSFFNYYGVSLEEIRVRAISIF